MMKNGSGKKAYWIYCRNFVILSIIIVQMSGIVASAVGNGTIKVSTNRYVILDDWNTTASIGAGFSKPGATHNTDSWTGINTRINATALFIDERGSPLAGKIVTFSLYMPNNTELVSARVNATTNVYGLADFSFDMNSKNYYGNWTVMASNGSLYKNTSFIYNWWGCGIGGCRSGHISEIPSTGGSINSPYLGGRDATVNANSAHRTTGLNCTNCHQSFDGKPGANAAGGVNHTNNPQDVHRNIMCDNPGCHQTLTAHQTNAVIGSCFSASCHIPPGISANRSDISNKSTLNTAGLSLYSYNNGSTFNSTFHTPNSTVPCFICHGPMHNITKPDESQRFIKNNVTEDSHCTTCHSNYSQHNNSINCTLCHSNDVHAIKVFAQNATYVDLNYNDPNPDRGNCTNCHQNATFFGLLKDTTRNPKAGNYTGPNPPQVQTPLNHSNDLFAGQKWNNYWSNGTGGYSQSSSCNFCHGSTQHDLIALGRPFQFKGNNVVGSTISNTTYWCSSCHWKGYSSGAKSYIDMVNIYISLMVPPEITGHATYGANQSKPGYFNHSYVSKDDASCLGCHGYLTSSTNITGLLHNIGYPPGYINGTVRNGTNAPVSGVHISTIGAEYTTGSDGKYLMMVPEGNYTVNASKQPEFYDYTIAGKKVTQSNTTTVDIPMVQKPTGTISGLVKKV